MVYVWYYPDGGSAWIGLGWFPTQWDPAKKDFTYIVPVLQSNIASTSQGWWYAWQDLHKPRMGRHEQGGLILEGDYEVASGDGQ